MTTIVQNKSELRLQVEKLLERKADIDRRNKEAGTNLVSHDFWLVDAVEVLLRIELGRTV
jgi:hypothetical protein